MSTVLITGGAKRIGLEIAKFFAKNGWNIAMHCNNSVEIAEKNAEDFEKKYNISCKVYQFNLEDFANVGLFFSKVINDFQQIDVLINNASFFEESSIFNSNATSILNNFAVHFFSPVFLSQEFSKQKNIENGLIINFLDKNITRTKTKYFEYLQSKKSLFELTKYLAIELAPKIRVNAISPGFILEEENSVVNSSYLELKLKSIPLQNKGSVEDIIKAIQYLLNSKYVTGENLFVDGGAFLLND